MANENFKTLLSFQGLISAPFTAFNNEGEVNLEVIPKYVDHLVKQGVKGVFVNGTTGEGLSLSVTERKDAAQAWVKYGKKKLEVIIICIGANSVKDVQELAAHAQKIGATGIAALPPLFYKVKTDGVPKMFLPGTLVIFDYLSNQLVEYYKKVSEAAPSLPLMYYHFPDYSGVQLTLGTFLPKARAAIPNLIGAKFTCVDVRDLLHCHRLKDSFKLISGYEEVFLPALSCGVTAAIGADYSFMAPLSLKILESYKKGNIEEARQHQNRVEEIHEEIFKYGQEISCYKAVMNLMGPIDFGEPRAPLFPLDSKSLEKLKKDLKKLKSEEWQRI